MSGPAHRHDHKRSDHRHHAQMSALIHPALVIVWRTLTWSGRVAPMRAAGPLERGLSQPHRESPRAASRYRPLRDVRLRQEEAPFRCVAVSRVLLGATRDSDSECACAFAGTEAPSVSGGRSGRGSRDRSSTLDLRGRPRTESRNGILKGGAFRRRLLSVEFDGRGEVWLSPRSIRAYPFVCLANYYSAATPSSATGCRHLTVDASISTWMAPEHLQGDSRRFEPGHLLLDGGFVRRCGRSGRARTRAVVAQLPDPSLWIPRPTGLLHPVAHCHVGKRRRVTRRSGRGRSEAWRLPIAFGDEELHGLDRFFRCAW